MSSQLRRTLAAKSVSAIRKAKHNQKKKPYSEICHGMDQDTVNSLMVNSLLVAEIGSQRPSK